MDFFRRLFDSDFMPHGHCYFWKPEVLWTNLLGDAFTALSYYIIPLLLIYFLRKRPDVGFRPVFGAFAVFILACGTTHIIAIISIWHPMYRLEGLMKVITAVVSVGTVGVLGYLMPLALKIPTPEKMLSVEAAKEQSDQKLQASVQRVQAMMKHAPIGMASVNFSGHFTEVNAAMCQMFKYTEEEFKQLSFRDITHPDFQQVSKEQIGLLNAEQVQSFQLEKRYLRSDGTSFWGLVHVGPIKGEPFHIVQILDIDEKKQREDSAKAMNKKLETMVGTRTSELREINEDLENFIYIITHDFRVPIHNLQGLSQVVMEEISELEEGSEMHQALRMIGENATIMDELIIDLMAFSKANKLTLAKHTVDMGQLAKTVFDELRPMYTSTPVQFTCESLPQANGDAAALHQVWQNLLSNALKYSSKKDKIVIEVTGIEETDRFIYAVKDNGIGFDPQYSEKLFHLFQRLHTSEEFEGTGMGLATSHRLVHKHGGHMWAESQPGQGATFYFSLPK